MRDVVMSPLSRIVVYSDARKHVPGTDHGLILVRLAQPGREALFERPRSSVP